MGNRAIAEMFEAVADIFWSAHGDGVPTRHQALQALDAIGNRFRGADANSSDAMNDPASPLGRMIALAFEATPEELVAGSWYDGPKTRFRSRYDFC